MSLTRVFTTSSGRISADFRKNENEATRGIGEVLGKAVDDPTAVSLEDYTGEDGAGVDASDVKKVIPKGSTISYSDLYGLTSEVTRTTSRTTSYQRSRTTSFSQSYTTQYLAQKLTKKCFFLIVCNQSWTTFTASRTTYRTQYRTTYFPDTRTTTVSSLSEKGGHRSGRPIYRYYRWTKLSDGSYRLTAKDENRALPAGEQQ